MLFLKQSTASQAVLIGPFIDKTDGSTAETGLTVANTDIRLSANGGNMFAKTSGGGTHDEAGWYQITLDATDTATVGRLQVSTHITADALPTWNEFQVLEEAIYDALFAASAAGFDANQRVDVGSWLGTAVTLGSGAPDVNIQSTDDIDLSATQKASVNTEALDVMNVDTITLPGQIAPPLAPTHRQAISWLYKAFRNRKLLTATQWSLLADDESTVDSKATVSDDATTAIKQEIVSGP